MLTSIKDMKPGEYFQVDSNEGGIKTAPCVRKILAVGEKSIASTLHKEQGYYYKLKMENYLETTANEEGVAVHHFSK